MHRLDPVARENWLKGQRAPERRERVREWMTGRAMDAKRDELPAGGAGEKALEDVTAEVARKRAEGNGKDG